MTVLRKLLIVIPALMAALLTANCGDETESKSMSYGDVIAKASPYAGASSSTAAFSLEGSWLSPLTDLGSGIWSRETMTVSGSSIVYLITTYTGTTTADMVEAEVITINYTFTITGDSSSVSGAKKINMTYISESAIMKTDDSVLLANAAAYFTYTDWVKNVSRDGTGKEYQPGDGVSNPGDISYDIIKLTGNAFQFGDNSASDACTSEATRPTALDPVVFTKQ